MQGISQAHRFAMAIFDLSFTYFANLIAVIRSTILKLMCRENVVAECIAQIRKYIEYKMSRRGRLKFFFKFCVHPLTSFKFLASNWEIHFIMIIIFSTTCCRFIKWTVKNWIKLTESLIKWANFMRHFKAVIKLKKHQI